MWSFYSKEDDAWIRMLSSFKNVSHRFLKEQTVDSHQAAVAREQNDNKGHVNPGRHTHTQPRCNTVTLHLSNSSSMSTFLIKKG